MAELKFDYTNSLEQAWNDAHQNGKALLILWSIDWCPPCNRLKTELAEKPEVMTGHQYMVTAYQDGDQVGAQAIAEQLYLSGYPTIALVKPEQPYVAASGENGGLQLKAKELFRLRGDLSLSELGTALQLADKNLMPLEDMLSKNFAQLLSVDQWQLLSYVDFLPFKEFLSSDALIQIFKKLLTAVPSSLPTAKAQFSSYFLLYIAERLEGMAGEYRDKILPVIQEAVTHLGESQQTMYQVRSFLIDEAEGFIAKLGKSFPSGAGDVAVTETAISLRAWAEHLYSEEQLSVCEAQAYRLSRAKQNGGTEPVDVTAIAKAATPLDGNHTYARNGSLSLYYSSLCHNAHTDAEQRAEAMSLLKEQILRGNNASFYGMKLAYHYIEDGEFAVAEKAMAEAVDAAFYHDGEATQLQWLATQFSMGIELIKKGYDMDDTALFAPVDRFIHLADSMADGYLGRNYKQCFTIYRELAQNPDLKDRSDRYSDLAATLDARVEAVSK